MKNELICSRFQSLYLYALMITMITQSSVLSYAQETPKHELLNQSAAQEKQNTLMILDSQAKSRSNGARNSFDLSTDLAVGNERAKVMVQIIQDAEMKKALEKITARGNKILKENPEIHTPVGLLAGMASLWFGRNTSIIKNENIQMSTHIEGRSRSGSFNVTSPLLNGQLRYSQQEGANVGVSRSISSFNTNAVLNYNINNQSVSTQLNQRLSPNINFCLGAEQDNGSTEGTASINYELHF